MYGYPIPGIVVPSSHTSGVVAPMYVSILDMVSEFPSSTPVSTSASMVSAVSSLVRGFGDRY